MGIYNAEISAGSLMPLESKRIAALLLTNPTENEWSQALKGENLLQKKSPATARRQARLIRNRLETLDQAGWQHIAGGDKEVTTQLLLAASIRHSRLLGDFLVDVYAQHLRRLELSLSPRSWEAFLTECIHRDAAVGEWADSTKRKLFQVIVRILAEAGFIDSTRKMNLTPPMLHPTVVTYLKRLGDGQTLACMEQAR
ncbi:MAG: DUF1819 family protein [Sulfuricellaceae bacterium]|nr:DUF1819 family protein [Sulfuricellaceae bacterium]